MVFCRRVLEFFCDVNDAVDRLALRNSIGEPIFNEIQDLSHIRQNGPEPVKHQSFKIRSRYPPSARSIFCGTSYERLCLIEKYITGALQLRIAESQRANRGEKVKRSVLLPPAANPPLNAGRFVDLHVFANQFHGPHSILAPDALTTVPSLSISDAISALNSIGPPGIGSIPCFVIHSRNSL